MIFMITAGFDRQPLDLNSSIQPIGRIPHPQNGYGNGLNQLAQPDDVEILPDGSLLITDVNNNRIQHFSKEGTLIQSITAKNLGLASDSELEPTGISRDGEGFIYVSLEGIGRIARFSPSLTFDQFIGRPCTLTAEEYYLPENEDCLVKPQGLSVSQNGDVFIIDMAKKVFENGKQRNFGFRKFKQTKMGSFTSYQYDADFASTQEITTIMRKSEGMAIHEKQNLLLIAEEKPSKNQFGNSMKKRYVAVFDMITGRFKNILIGVNNHHNKIINGYFDDSIEGISVWENHLFAVDEKKGKILIFEIGSGTLKGMLGSKAHFYCDDHSDCVIEGINYNEQTIMAQKAFPHLKNDWQKNELASPDGISTIELMNGQKRMAVVDQWNSRILLYDLASILKSID